MSRVIVVFLLILILILIVVVILLFLKFARMFMCRVLLVGPVFMMDNLVLGMVRVGVVWVGRVHVVDELHVVVLVRVVRQYLR